MPVATGLHNFHYLILLHKLGARFQHACLLQFVIKCGLSVLPVCSCTAIIVDGLKLCVRVCVCLKADWE